MSILTNTSAASKHEHTCLHAEHYFRYRIKLREFSRIYVRESNQEKKLDYTAKYTYVPKDTRDAVNKSTKYGLGVDQKHALSDLKEMECDFLITKRVTRKKRSKQYFKPLGWYCYSCKLFYTDEDMREYQRKEGLILTNEDELKPKEEESSIRNSQVGQNEDKNDTG